MRNLSDELERRGAREYEIVLLSADEERAWLALDAALERGADNIIRYAMSLFEDPAWKPNPGKPRHITNAAAAITACETCGGDRFVVFSTRAPTQSAWMNEKGIRASTDEIEEMAPCPDCNPADTSFWRTDGTKFESPDPARVRARAVRQ